MGGGESSWLFTNEKDMLQNLKDCLNIYLDKAGSLKQANSALYYNIKAQYKKFGSEANSQGGKQDYEKYYNWETLKQEISLLLD